MDDILLGIDVGTSACKVAAFAPDGQVLAQQNAGYPVLHPRQGWAEQDPEAWWDAVCAATRALLAESGLNPAAIKGVGADGQSWSAIAVDSAGRALGNTPIWMDTRARDICEELAARLDMDALFAVSGNALQPSYTLPKVLWYKRHLPELYANARVILQSNSYIAFRLAGVYSQEKSQGYGLACYDMARGRWDDGWCEALGIDRALLPEIVDSHQVIGGVTAEAAAATGLLAGTPVVAGGLDAACGTLGAGVLAPGQTQEQGGQAGGMSICTDAPMADPRLILSNHVVPGRWLLQGGTVGGGGVVKWFEREFGAAERALAEKNGTASMAEMDKAAAEIVPGSDGMLFLPYMSGERSPIWDPDATGVYYGVDFAKTRAHFARASMEGVAFSLRHNLEVAAGAGAEAGALRAMGGAANSRLWTQIKADVTGKPIEVPSSDTATALGAAILAGVGTGVYQSFEQAVAATVQIKRTHQPNPENKAVYDERFAQYLALYDNLKNMMREAKP